MLKSFCKYTNIFPIVRGIYIRIKLKTQIIKHLRIFNSISDFESLKATLEDGPYVVLDKDGKVVATNLKTISLDDITGGEYIDLGLQSGLKWASCNLGASKPCEYGKYFQWGDTVGYEGDEALAHSYWETAPFNNGSSSYDSAYFDANKSQWLDENDNLKPEYDAVSVATGGEAHMPTMADFEELLSCTTYEWCTCVVLGDDHKEHNVNGRLFTSKVNGNKIFIPTAGYAWSGLLNDQGSYALLWSSSLDASSHSGAWYLHFNSGYCGVRDNDRYYGFSVRGVKS